MAKKKSTTQRKMTVQQAVADNNRAATQHVRQTFATADGKATLKLIKHFCLFDQSTLAADPTTGEINIKATMYQEGLRNFYLWLRKFIDPVTLRDVEIPLQDTHLDNLFKKDE